MFQPGDGVQPGRMTPEELIAMNPLAGYPDGYTAGLRFGVEGYPPWGPVGPVAPYLPFPLAEEQPNSEPKPKRKPKPEYEPPSVPLPGIGDLDGDNGRLARGGGEIVELLEELAKSFKGKRDWPGNKVRTGETRSKDKLFSNKKFMDDLMALFRTYGIVPGRPATRKLRSCKRKVSAWIEGAYDQLLDYFEAKIAALERQISFVESTGGAGPGRSWRTGPLLAELHRWRQELELLRARLDALLERARSVEEPPPADNR